MIGAVGAKAVAGASVRPQPWQRSGWSRGSNFKADGQPGEVRRVQMQERERGRPVSCAGESPQLFFGRVSLSKESCFFCLVSNNKVDELGRGQG
jgi:hypothetical protein